jgi:hypothetical protein
MSVMLKIWYICEGHFISHGSFFFAKNVAVQEMEYMCLKAHGMYL